MLAYMHENLDIAQSSPSRRETTGIGSRYLRLIKLRKHRFCCVFAAFSWIDTRILNTCPLVSCSLSLYHL